MKTYFNKGNLKKILSISFAGLFILMTVAPRSFARVFTEIHVGKWIPTGQEVVVGVMATLPNTCTLFDEIDSDVVAPMGSMLGQLNIRVTIIESQFTTDSDLTGELGCKNETHYVYERINFGTLEPGPYEVRVYENGQLALTRKLNVSEFPAEPIFSEPGGFYNLGWIISPDQLVAYK